MFKYQSTTRAITVTVEPTYLDDQSSPDRSHFVWKYHVRIENGGSETVQLQDRYWRITGPWAGSKRCAAPAWSASSRSWRPARPSNTPPARR